jgi:hypothetical protein
MVKCVFVYGHEKIQNMKHLSTDAYRIHIFGICWVKYLCKIMNLKLHAAIHTILLSPELEILLDNVFMGVKMGLTRYYHQT